MVWTDKKCECNNTAQQCDTLGLLDGLGDSKFAEEFVAFATGQRYLHDLPALYNFVKRRIFAVKTDQQSIEGGFNMVDIYGETNMSVQTLGATIALAYNGDMPVSEEAMSGRARETSFP